MNMVTFVIYKQEAIWGLESTNHSHTELVRSQHGSRDRAIDSLFKHYPNLPFFHLILPITSDTKAQDFMFRTSLISYKRMWLAESREYPSRAKALSSFFARHPRITLFYIVIPVGVESTHGNSSKKSNSEQVAGSTPITPNKGE